jgi:hypothetical protein
MECLRETSLGHGLPSANQKLEKLRNKSRV